MAQIFKMTITLDSGKVINVKIIYNSRLQRIIYRWFGMSGLTIRNTIRFTGSPEQMSPTSLTHELCHVKQWYKLGFFKFLYTYIKEQIKHGYDKNQLEQEARESAGEPLR